MDSITEYYENNLDKTIDIDGTIDYSGGFLRHNLFLPYETIKAALKLDEKLRALDEMLLNTSHSAIERYIDRIITLRKIEEDVIAKDGIIYPHETPIKSVVSLVDTENQEDADSSLFEVFSDKINIGTTEHDAHICRLSYIAGYKSGEGPEEFVEAIIKTFIAKRRQLYREMNESPNFDEEDKNVFSLTDEVKSLLGSFKR